MDKLWFFPTILRVREVGDTAVQIKKLYNNGVRMFILAPCFEYIDGTEKNLERLEYCKTLAEESRRKYKSIMITVGSSIKYYDGMTKDCDKGKILPVGNGRYILLRFERDSDYSFICNAVNRCYEAGFRPVIEEFDTHESLIDYDNAGEIIERGALLCAEISILNAKFKRDERRNIEKLMEKWMVHFIVDDFSSNTVEMHQEIVKIFEEKYGELKTNAVFYDNFISMYENRPIV